MSKIRITSPSVINDRFWYNDRVGEEFELVQALLWSSPPKYIVKYEDDQGVLKWARVDAIDAKIVK